MPHFASPERAGALVLLAAASSSAALLSLRTGPTAEWLSKVWDQTINGAFGAGPVDATRFMAVSAFSERLVRRIDDKTARSAQKTDGSPAEPA
ncbi:hypothetical protein V1T76_14480 [Roseibium sp. FZY0029]|uniref:hypothetical protein n=1 Tax=Roseibium sp. FZY0029 TaxID=3116647 RepID=UPI002E9EBDD9|nr:hypothetical protein [Roseibium sp. FZY0029]